MFRKEVVESQGRKLLGDISLNQPVSIYLIIAIIIISVTSIIIFLLDASYSRKETVKGYLSPNTGLIKQYPNQSGSLDTLFVEEGKLVDKGDILANVVFDRPQIDGRDLSESVISVLEQQKEFLERDFLETKLLLDKEFDSLRQKKRDLKLSLKSMDSKIILLEKKHLIQINKLQRFKKLYSNKYISNLDLQSQEQELLHAKEMLEDSKANRISMQSQINDIKYKIEKLPHEMALKLTEIQKSKSILERQIKEAENNYVFSIIAKDSGIVTAISAKEGERLSVNRPLLSLIPKNAELMAELFLPTRSAGFIEKTDEVRLRFEAFPYQRFGFIKGAVTRIDKSIVVNGEIDVPITLQEPVYRVQVKLKEQSFKAYDKLFPLKTGMLLEADIILENRSLIQWLLDPIYSLRGRIE